MRKSAPEQVCMAGQLAERLAVRLLTVNSR